MAEHRPEHSEDYVRVQHFMDRRKTEARMSWDDTERFNRAFNRGCAAAWKGFRTIPANPYGAATLECRAFDEGAQSGIRDRQGYVDAGWYDDIQAVRANIAREEDA